ncbi:MAG: hypothetical protein ACRDH9_11030, partial [Actinomycetota bacterium]
VYRRGHVTMRTKVLIWMAASAMVLTLSQPASADTGRTVVDPFEFYALGQGDTGGACINDPGPTDPPETAALQSCATALPLSNEDRVGITVTDSAGQPVYFTVQQDGNSAFAGGCGTLQWGTLSADGLFPINGSGPGGTQAPDVVVTPLVGPGINDVLDPGGAACTGNVDPLLVLPGRVGTVTFTFHNHVL